MMRVKYKGYLVVTLLAASLSSAFAQQQKQISSTLASSETSSSVSAGASRMSSAGLSAVPEDFSRLKIAPGFLLTISVFDEPALSGSLRVDDAGDIAFPLVGPIHVGDCTLADARQRVEAQLISSQILLHPQVSINIEQYTPFVIAVIGEVQSPGRVQFLAPHSLLDVLTQVGGETTTAGGTIQVRHSAPDGRTTIDTYPYERSGNGASIASVMVHAGDTVIVPRAGIVYVLGAVNRPGGYLMQEDGELNVAQALSLAAGTILQAQVNATRVVRHNADGTYSEYPINYKAIASGKEKPMRLQAQDIVYVPVSKVKSLFTTGGALINEAASATVYLYR